MERLMLAEGQIMDFDILTQKMISDYFDTNLIIYFVLDGEVKISVNGEDSTMKVKDFILINSCQHHSYRAAAHTLAARFVISTEELSKYYDIRKVEFRCDSTKENSEQYASFRHLLEICIGNYYGKEAGDGKSLIRLNSTYYQILESLVSHFAEYASVGGDAQPDADEERINAIVSYIHANYKRQISLNDLSEKMFLSTAYVSRYIKKKLGVNLGEYLTNIRLDYAVRELEKADKSIARVALDNGFPNIASFNKAFKERYHLTPKGYQEEYLLKSKNGSAADKLSGDMEYRLMDYLNHTEDGILENQDYQETFSVDTNKYRYLPKTWSRMINIGRVILLLRSDVQEHVLFLKEKLKIEYVRMWDIYDEDLQINASNIEGKHNFSKLDKVVDFLVSHQLRPYFELGFKPVILRDSYETYITHKERKILFHSSAEYGYFLNLLMIHFVNRYGIYEVSQWYFEQWCDPRLFENGDPKMYFETFDTAYKSIKEISPDTKVGGSFDRPYGIIDFERLVEQCSRRNIQPDFVSIYCYNILAKDAVERSGDYVKKEKAPDFLRAYLMHQKNILYKYGLNVPVHISEWNLTVVTGNVLNDSCFKGAYIMKNLMEMYAEVEMAGYWFGTDLFVEYEEAPKVLDGYCGLISYHGICKPAFYAMDFMNRLKEYLLGQTDNMMVSMDGYDNYVIVCHNYKHYGIQYQMQDEKDIKIEKIPLLFDDHSRLKINVQINNVKNGFYYVKTRSISQKNGSIQDEWMSMGLAENLNDQDIDYLKRISTPRITIYEYTVNNNMLDINIALDPHEIQCIHIYRQIREPSEW